MDTSTEFETVVYTAPVLSTLGTVTGATLGSSNQDNEDDTEYWQ
ncbi:hypothetical protein ACF09G_31895 [Streptomyces albogriseolus]|nr:hypothetical protein [Streptomyces sp. GC420]